LNTKCHSNTTATSSLLAFLLKTGVPGHYFSQQNFSSYKLP